MASTSGYINSRPYPETSMVLSIEQERDSYKEKVEHMKILLRRMDEDLQSQRIRKEGVETVSKLLQETRQENIMLHKRLKTTEAQIENLQSRLTVHGLSANVILGEEDIFIPGSSNQLLDNLARENTRLRTLLRGASVDPEEITKLQQISIKKQEEIDSYKTTLQAYYQRISELEDTLALSDNEKDVKISQLQITVRKMKDDFQTRDILCHSLAEETSVLKQQLHDVAVNCQQMALRLERSDKLSKSDSSAGSATESRKDEIVLREKNELQKKFNEVVIMNKRWQEYDNQRDKYVQHLQGIIRSLQENGASSLSVERTRKINHTIAEAQSRLRIAEEEKKQLHEELTERNQQLIQQSGEVERLKNELDNALLNGTTYRSDAEVIEALKAQIQVCTEDFESERKDREKAQSRLSHLQAELDTVKSEKNRLQQAVRPRETMGQGHDFYSNFNIPHGYQQHYENDLAARGPGQGHVTYNNQADFGLVTDSPQNTVTKEENNSIEEGDTVKHKDDERCVSGLQSTVDFPSLPDEEIECEELADRGVTNDASSVNINSVLTCPKCSREFTSDKHTELLEHIEVCCD